MIISMIAQNN